MKNLTCISPKELWHFIIDEPLLAHFLLRSHILEVKDFNAVAAVRVSQGRIELRLNPAVISALRTSEKLGVLVHEYLHVLLKHCTKRSKHKYGAKALKQNIAMDLAINQIIRGNWELPSMAIFHDQDPYNFSGMLSAEEYFDLIEEKFSDQDMLDMYGADEGFDLHDWEYSAANEAFINETIKSYLNSKRGSRLGKTIQSSPLAGSFAQEILACGENEISWVLQTKKFLAKCKSKKKIRSYKRTNRRYGFPVRGSKYKRTSKAVAIIDTSCSITDEMLGYVVSNLNAMSVIMDLDVLMCDAECQTKIINFRSVEGLNFKGRGGTDLQPAFDQALEDGYRAIVVFTDGDLFRDVESDVQTLWVILGNKCFNPSFGEVCHVDW